MAEITQDGYVSLRTFIINKWNRVSLRDEHDNEVKRLIVGDDNAEWTHETTTGMGFLKDENGDYILDKFGNPIPIEVEVQSSQVLELTINLTGLDFSLPQTISRSVIEDEEGKEISVEDFQPFTFENENDELTIKHKIQVPALE